MSASESSPSITTPEPPAIEIEHLHFAYPDGTEALSGVDLTIRRGEAVAVIGPNGAGKSTLLLHLNGILRGQGEVRIFGVAIEDATLRETRRRVGVVFQDPDDQLFLTTVSQDVAFGPANMGLSEAEIARRSHEALDAVGMADFGDRAAHHLSFGQKKRVATATVLSMNPDVLVLDEPSSNLDPRSRRKLAKILAALPVTKVIVTHDLPYAYATCRRAVILSGGRVVADGPIESILADEELLAAHGLELPYGFVPEVRQAVDPPVTVRLRRLPPLTTLALHTRGPYWRLSGAVARLRSRLEEAGIEPAGPLFGLFHDDPARVPPEETRYTLCYPLDPTGVTRATGWPAGTWAPTPAARGTASADASASSTPADTSTSPDSPDTSGAIRSVTDTLELLEFPATEAATAEYQGPAAGSPAVYEQVEAWIAERGYAADGPPREVYLAEPGTLGKGLMHAEVQQPVFRPQAPEAR